MTTLIITVGIPGSGKSTEARRWVAEDPTSRLRVNRDDTRAFLGLGHGDNEPLVTQVQQAAVRAGLADGKDVIVDDTNLVPRFAKEWLKIAREAGAEVTWWDQFLSVPVQTCITRDRNRTEKVGVDVIMKMHERAEQWKRPSLSSEPDLSQFEKYVPDESLPAAFLVDLDGTIAHNGGHRGFFDWAKVGDDEPVSAIIEIVKGMKAAGLQPIYVSGRDAVCYAETYDWIADHVDERDQITLFMRAERDQRKDSIIKLEIFDREIRNNYNVRFCLDDRNQVVRAYRDVLGLTVLQVRDGEF